jgi:hypothetical protein
LRVAFIIEEGRAYPAFCLLASLGEAMISTLISEKKDDSHLSFEGEKFRESVSVGSGYGWWCRD